MLNGITAGPFVRSAGDAGFLAEQVGGLFLHGFLQRSAEPHDVALALGGTHDA
jgi:hypothetical protein